VAAKWLAIIEGIEKEVRKVPYYTVAHTPPHTTLHLKKWLGVIEGIEEDVRLLSILALLQKYNRIEYTNKSSAVISGEHVLVLFLHYISTLLRACCVTRV
jgi:hypothetical protein